MGALFAVFLGDVLYDLGKVTGTSLNGPLVGAMLLLNMTVVKNLFFRTAVGHEKRKAMADKTIARVLALSCVWMALKWSWQLLVPYWEHIKAVLADPMPLNAMEGREAVKAWLLAHGTNIYPAMDAHPFLVTIYPPGYHAAIAALSAFLGWDIITARIVSLLAFAALALTTCFMVNKAAGSVLAAGIVLPALAFDPVLSDWSLHARPDMLAWALALAGTGLFWGACEIGNFGTAPSRHGLFPRGAGKHGMPLAMASGVFFCLALYTKQQTLPWLLSCLVWAAFKGRAGWRPGFVTALSCLGLGAVLAGVLELMTGGNFLRDVALYPKLMGALPGVSTAENLLVRLGQIWDAFRTLWLLFAAYTAYALWNRRWDLPLVLAVVNAAFMVKLLASWGADINYAFGTVLAAFLGVGLLVGAVARSRPYGKALAFALLFVWLPTPSGRPGPPPVDVSALASLSGRVLANTEGGHLFTKALPGREVLFFDGIETQLYEQTGLWDSHQSALVRDIRSRAFDRIVLYGDFLPPAVADAVSIYYAASQRVGQYTVNAPAQDSLIIEVSPAGQALVQGEGNVLADVSTLARETEGLAPADKQRPGFLRLRIESPRDLGRVQAALVLRLDPKDPSGSATVRIEDGQGRVLAASTATHQGRAEVTLAAEGVGRAAELVVELKGRAWVEPHRGALAVVRAGG